jgi:hypothetical protein
MTLQLHHSEFPHIWGKIDFFISVAYSTLPERSDWAGPAPSCRPSAGWLSTCSRRDPWSSCTHTQRWNLHYACETLCRHSAQLADSDLSVSLGMAGQLLARQNFYIIKGSAYGYTADHSCIIYRRFSSRDNFSVTSGLTSSILLKIISNSSIFISNVFIYTWHSSNWFYNLSSYHFLIYNFFIEQKCFLVRLFFLMFLHLLSTTPCFHFFFSFVSNLTDLILPFMWSLFLWSDLLSLSWSSHLLFDIYNIIRPDFCMSTYLTPSLTISPSLLWIAFLDSLSTGPFSLQWSPSLRPMLLLSNLIFFTLT